MATPRKAKTRRSAQSRASVRSQPLIAVRDVRKSSRWYARLLGAERASVLMHSDHAHIYDRLLSNSKLVLQLHSWGEEDHPNLVNERKAAPGHGVLLWFEIDDFDAAVRRARAMRASVVLEPHENRAPDHRELWLRDLDGFYVVIASPDGEASRANRRKPAAR